MIVRRAVGSLLATALVSTALGVVATAAPAAADDPIPTRIVPGDGHTAVVEPEGYKKQPGLPAFGSDLYVNVNVQALVNGVWEQLYYGSVSVTQTLEGGAAQVVAQNDSPYVYSDIPAQGNATYTVNYSGATGAGYPPANYAPATATLGVAVQRQLAVKNVGHRKVVLHGKVGPAFHGKVTIVKKVGKKWKRFKTVRTNKKSVFKTPLPAPNRGRFYWRVLIKAGGGFSATDSGQFWTYRL
jgi:hypothetical protein